jgi:hypothetical protein
MLPSSREQIWMRAILVVMVLGSLFSSPASTQTPRRWEIRGDTSGAPRSCSANEGLDAIDAWFAAMSNHDSAALARVVPASHFVFSIGSFTPTHPFFVAHTIGELAEYSRRRAKYHEKFSITAVTFNNWRGYGLQFGPIYFMRTADDLGPHPKPGFGKGEYRCKRGITVLNTGPRPALDDGRRAMRPPRRTH